MFFSTCYMMNYFISFDCYTFIKTDAVCSDKPISEAAMYVLKSL
jgi:hypothetical protein